MTAIREFIFSQLTSNAAVAAIVQRRVYYVKMPDNPILPAVVHQLVMGQHTESFDGDSGLHSAVIDIHSFAKSADDAANLAEACRTCLHGFKGTYGTLVIQNVLNWSEHDLYDSDTEVFHVASSCKVWYYDTE